MMQLSATRFGVQSPKNGFWRKLTSRTSCGGSCGTGCWVERDPNTGSCSCYCPDRDYTSRMFHGLGQTPATDVAPVGPPVLSTPWQFTVARLVAGGFVAALTGLATYKILNLR